MATTIRCGLCAEDLVFCGLCGLWYHQLARSLKCRGQDAHTCGTEPAPAALHTVMGQQARRYGT